MVLQYVECTEEFFDWMHAQLKAKNKKFSGSPMTPSQISESEDLHGLVFPSDFKRFLQHPVSTCEDFYKYSAPNGSSGCKRITSAMEGFQKGIEFDIEHNNLWEESWGPKPSTLNERLKIFRRVYANVIKLIPIFGHRALISNFHTSIVLSVHQTDIIVYGYNLAVYLQNEFLRDELQLEYQDAVGDCYSTVVPQIPFWSIFIG